MKTLSDYPMLMGRLIAADEARRLRRARWYAFWRSPWTTLGLLALSVVLLLVFCWEVSR